MEPARPSTDDNGPPTLTLIENLGVLWADLRLTAHDHLQLVALEAQRATLSLVWMAVYGAVVGMLVAASWLIVSGALVLWLIESGLGTSTALLLGAALNLLGAIGFAVMMRRKSEVLLFPATLRSFDQDPIATEPVGEPAAKKS